jgi:small-conductance mechanosensitive channel
VTALVALQAGTPAAAASGVAASAASTGSGDAQLWQTLPALVSTAALAELGILLLCLAAAWGLARLLRGPRARPDSIWFGNRIVDGVLFPALALLAAVAVRYALQAVWPLALFKLVVPVLSSLLVIRIAVRVLHAAFPTSPTVRLLERTISWLVWIALVMWLTGLLPQVLAEMDAIQWKLGGANVSLRSLIEGALSAVAVLVLALWLSASIESRLLAGAHGDGNTLSMRKIAANATRALLMLVGLLLALSAAGIPLAALGVFGGALGVGIGFGLQKLAANYVSGFVILAERSLRIGDMVRVDGFEGRITDIHTRYTVIRALNGRESIVPNELLITNRVENASLADARVQMSTSVGVAYGTDVDRLRPVIEAAVAQVPRVLSEPGPAVLLSAFAPDGLELTIAFWIDDPENGQGNVRSDVNGAILQALTTLGVQIPFPQRVLHWPAGQGAAPPPA